MFRVHMLQNITVIALLLFSARASAYHFPLEIIEQFDDARLVVFVQEGDIMQTPAWTPASGKPPLGIEEVVTKVNQWCTKDVKFRHSEILKIELKPIKRYEKKHRWFYLVQLRTPMNGKHSIQYLAVLMDGKVIPAIREPASIK